MLLLLHYAIYSSSDTMIEYLTGKITQNSMDWLVMDVNGIGYLCHVTKNTIEKFPENDDVVKLLIHDHITDSSRELFGFQNESERSMFRLLISVSGIGPKTGIAMLSNVSPGEFRKRIISSEVNMLTTIPGIGPKTAKRIIIELKDKFIKMADDDLPIEDDSGSFPAMEEAYNGLVSLEFKPSEVRKILKSIVEVDGVDSSENMIRKALTLLN